MTVPASTAVVHSWYMTGRHLRALSRQPWMITVSLIQPIIWVLLFAQLFRRVVEIPGFAATSYMTFLAPAIVIMTALFSGGWAGMSFIEDVDRGVLDRFLVAPSRRAALINGRLAYQSIQTAIQATIILVLALLVGASFPGGFLGVVVLIVCAILLGNAFASLSNALALVVRKAETVMATVQMVALPLQFLSTAFMPANLIPDWMSTVARFNPVNWAVVAGREALGADPDWSVVLSHGGYLLAFALVCAWLSVRAFRSYQRSV